jgi:WD40 repeat protein
VLFQSYDKDRGMSVWQTDLSGNAARALLPGTAATLVDAARDGSFLLFDKVDVDDGVWLLPLKGGTPRNLGPQIRTGLISPDASRILVYELAASPDGLMRPTIKILPANGGAAVTTLAVQDNAAPSVWGADSSSLTFLDTSDPIRNLSRIRLPNGKPERVTRFTEGRCTTFEWSPDGTRLAIARRVGEATNVWVTAADGSKPMQITRFPNDEIFQLHWSHDGKQVVINAGKNSSDAVLITNFR